MNIQYLSDRPDRLLVLGVRKLAVIADWVKATVLSTLLTVIWRMCEGNITSENPALVGIKKA